MSAKLKPNTRSVQAQITGEVNRMFRPEWLSLLIALISIFLAYFFYRKSRSEAKLYYQYRTLRLIERSEKILPDEVRISFKGLEVPRLSSSHIIFWNAGRGTIRQNDIVQSDPVRIVFSDGTHVLRLRVVSSTRATIAFAVKINPEQANEVLCTFDYLDGGDGAVVEILHTDEKRFPLVCGTIRGIPEGLKDCGRTLLGVGRLGVEASVSFSSSNRRLLLGVPFLVGVLMMIIGLLRQSLLAWFPFLQTLVWKNVTPESSPVDAGLIIYAMLYVVGFGYFLWRTRRRFPPNLDVDGLA